MMGQEAPEHFNQPGGIFALWTGVLAGPVVWMLDQQIKYMFLTYLCSPAGRAWVHLISILSFLCIIAAAFLSWRNWQRAGSTLSDDKGGTFGRSRFMSLLGLLMNGLFSLLIVAQWLPGFFFNPCER
jgi:TRAP-type C4-dicarboxylate transport system permease small subunit